MDRKFQLEKVPFINLKETEDKCPRFIVTSLEKYPEEIKILRDLQKLLQAENIFFQDRFYLEVKKSEKKRPIGWHKFLKEKIRETIDIEFDVDNLRISGSLKF